jgi:hypothetical protein
MNWLESVISDKNMIRFAELSQLKAIQSSFIIYKFSKNKNEDEMKSYDKIMSQDTQVYSSS